MAASGGNIEWSTTVKPILTALYGPFFDKNDAVEIIQAIIKSESEFQNHEDIYDLFYTCFACLSAHFISMNANNLPNDQLSTARDAFRVILRQILKKLSEAGLSCDDTNTTAAPNVSVKQLLLPIVGLCGIDGGGYPQSDLVILTSLLKNAKLPAHVSVPASQTTPTEKQPPSNAQRRSDALLEQLTAPLRNPVASMTSSQVAPATAVLSPGSKDSLESAKDGNASQQASIDMKKWVASTCSSLLMELRAGSVVLKVCSSLPCLQRYLNRWQTAKETAVAPQFNSDASLLHFLVNEVHVCRLALSLPCLEPFTPERIMTLSDVSIAGLLCATAQASLHPKDEEYEQQTATLVESALSLYNTVGETFKQSTRAGGYVYQNHLMIGGWVLLCGLHHALAGAPCPSTTPGKSPAKTPSRPYNLTKMQQGLGVVWVALGGRCLAWVGALLSDARLEALSCGEAVVTTPAPLHILAQHTAHQRELRLASAAPLHQLLVALGVVCYRKATNLKRAVVQKQHQDADPDRSDSTVYFQDMILCSEDSETDDVDSEPLFGLWFESTLVAPDATDNSGLVRASGNNDNNDNADAPQRPHQAIVPDKAEPYSYITLATEVFTLLTEEIISEGSERLGQHSLQLHDAHQALLAALAKDLDRETARTDTGTISACFGARLGALYAAFSSALVRYLHNLSGAPAFASLQPALHQQLISAGSERTNMTPLQVGPRVVKLLGGMVLSKQAAERENSILAMWHKIVNTLQECALQAQPSQDHDYEDLNVEHAQLLVYLFHSLTLMQKKSVLLMTSNAIIKVVETLAISDRKRAMNLAPHQLMLTTRLMLLLEYLMRHLYDAPQTLLQQIEWNLVIAPGLAQPSTEANANGNKTTTNGQPKSRIYCEVPYIEQAYRRLSQDESSMRPKFYALTSADINNQENPKFDGLACNFVLGTPHKLKYPLLLDALLALLNSACICDNSQYHGSPAALAAAHYCYQTAWRLVISMPPATPHMDKLQAGTAADLPSPLPLHAVVWAPRADNKKVFNPWLKDALVKQGMYTQYAENLLAGVSASCDNIKYTAWLASETIKHLKQNVTANGLPSLLDVISCDSALVRFKVCLADSATPSEAHQFMPDLLDLLETILDCCRLSAGLELEGLMESSNNPSEAAVSKARLQVCGTSGPVGNAAGSTPPPALGAWLRAHLPSNAAAALDRLSSPPPLACINLAFYAAHIIPSESAVLNLVSSHCELITANTKYSLGPSLMMLAYSAAKLLEVGASKLADNPELMKKTFDLVIPALTDGRLEFMSEPLAATLNTLVPQVQKAEQLIHEHILKTTYGVLVEHLQPSTEKTLRHMVKYWEKILDRPAGRLAYEKVFAENSGYSLGKILLSAPNARNPYAERVIKLFIKIFTGCENELNGNLCVSVCKFIGVADQQRLSTLLAHICLGAPATSTNGTTGTANGTPTETELPTPTSSAPEASGNPASLAVENLSSQEVLDKLEEGQVDGTLAPQIESACVLLSYLADALHAINTTQPHTWRSVSPTWESPSDLGFDLDYTDEQQDDDDTSADDSDEDAMLQYKLCTFTVTQREFMNQHWYHCHTCKMVDGVGVCTVCARVCHRGHDVSYAKFGNFFCCRQYLSSYSGWGTCMERVRRLLEALAGPVRAACERAAPTGAHGRAQRALAQLHLGEKKFTHTDNLMLPTLGSQEGAFENVRMSYTGETGQTIRQLMSAHKLRRVAMCCLASPQGRRQHLAVSHEKGKITVLQLSALLKQADSSKHKLTLTRLSSAPIPFMVLSLSGNPWNEDLLAVCGLKECHVLTFNSGGAVADHLVLNTGLEGNNYVIKAIWLPGSQTQLALVTSDFVKIYDLSKDLNNPMHHFLVPSGKVRDVTFVNQDGVMHMLCMSSAGHIYWQPMSEESRATLGTFYVTNTLEVLHPEIQDVAGLVGGGGVSIYYSHTLKMLFFSYAQGKSFLAPLNTVEESLKGTAMITLSTTSTQKEGGGRGGGKQGGVQSLCQWAEVPGHPGLVTAVMQASNNPVVLMLTPTNIFVQEIKVVPAKAKITDMVAVRHWCGGGGEQKSTLILLCEDGSLRMYAASSDHTGYWLSPAIQPTHAPRRRPRLLTHHSKGKAQQVVTKSNANGAPQFPIDFFEHCVAMNDIEFGGNDLLQVYNTAQIKHRLNTTGLYVVSTKMSGFAMEVMNSDPNMVICGIRVLLGSQDVARTPSYVEVYGRIIQTIVVRNRWFDIPLTREESLQSDKKLSINFGPSQDPDGVTMVDSVKVYGKNKEQFGWPEDNEDPSACPSSSKVAQEGEGAGGAWKPSPLERLACAALEALELGAGASAAGVHAAAEPARRLLCAPAPPHLHARAQCLLRALHHTHYHQYKDQAILKYVCTSLRELRDTADPHNIDPEAYFRLVLLARGVAVARPNHLVKYSAPTPQRPANGDWSVLWKGDNQDQEKEKEPHLCALLTSVLWRLAACRTSTAQPPGILSYGLRHPEHTMHALADTVHAFQLHAEPECVEFGNQIYLSLLLAEDQSISFGAKAALMRVLRPRVKRRRVYIPSPPNTPGTGAGSSVTTAQPTSSITEAVVSESDLSANRDEHQENQFMDVDDSLEPMVLLAPDGGLEALLDIPPDADDETMVELAIALSLQEQPRRAPPAPSAPPPPAPGFSDATASPPGSDDEGSTAATDGSTLRTSPAEPPGSAGSESGGSGADSIGGVSGRSSAYGEMVSAPSAGTMPASNIIAAPVAIAAGPSTSSSQPVASTSRTMEAESETRKLHALRLSLLSAALDALPSLRYLPGVRAIPFVQVVLMLAGDLDSSVEGDRTVLDRLLELLVSELDIQSEENPEERTDRRELQLAIMRLELLVSELDMHGDETPPPIHERTNRRELQLVIMRLLSVLMARWKTSATGGPVPRAEVTGGACAAHVSRLAAAALVRAGAPAHCFRVLSALLPYWKEKTSSSGAATTGQTLLKPQPPQPLPDMQPFFVKEYVKSHALDVFDNYPQLLMEMALRLPCQIHKHCDPAHFDQRWRTLLCEYMMNQQTPLSSSIRKQVRKLLLLLCGTRERYRQLRDVHALDTHLNAARALLATDPAYDKLVQLMDHLKACAEIVSARTGNWQHTCATERREALAWLVTVARRVHPHVAPTVLQLLQAALCAPPHHQRPAENKQNTADWPDRERSAENDAFTTDGSKFQEQRVGPLVQQILKQVSQDELRMFVKAFLLETNSTAVRWQAHALLLAIYNNSGQTDQSSLVSLLWGIWPTLPQYGRKAAQFVDLLGYFTLKTPNIDTEKYVGSAVELLRNQNQLLSSHGNAALYAALGSYVELDGYYLESEPCLVCNNPEVPMATIKLPTIKIDSKFTTTTQIVKLVNSHMISRINLRISDIKRSKMVRTINFYYNNRTVQAVQELKNRPGMWHKAKRVQLQSGQSEVRVDFPLPIVACNLMMEYADFYENQQATGESLQCPRCSQSVPANPGVCANCGENVFQCHKCRAINYDEKDPFLCHACGFCKYAKFDYTLTARPCCAVDTIENDEERKKMVQTIGALLDKADRVYRQLTSNKPVLERSERNLRDNHNVFSLTSLIIDLENQSQMAIPILEQSTLIRAESPTYTPKTNSPPQITIPLDNQGLGQSAIVNPESPTYTPNSDSLPPLVHVSNPLQPKTQVTHHSSSSALPVQNSLGNVYIESTSMLRHIDDNIPNLESVVRINSTSTDDAMRLATITRKTAPPLNLERERRMEELCWYFLYPDGKNGFGEERDNPCTPLDYFQNRIMSADKRFNRNDYLFYALSVVEYFRAKSSVSVSCRMRQGHGQQTPQGLVDNMHLTMRNVRGSASYWQKCCSELIAMVRTLGPPTWFLTFSCNDLNWPEMIKALLIADGRDINDAECLTFPERLELVQKHPVVIARQFTIRVNALMRLLKHNHDCLEGPIEDYWYRVEFQNRGSPHLHMLVWCNNVPEFSTPQGIEVIEKVVSCSLSPNDPVLRKLVEDLQIHKHTQTCKKNRQDNGCRFGFPKPASDNTVCLGPDEALANNGRFCLLKRTSDESMVNNYNVILLGIWKANIDIQPCGSYSAVAYYVAKYASKCEPHDAGEVIRDAISKAKRQGGDVWKQLFAVSMTILNQRLVSAPECAYRLCHLPLKMSSRKTVFVNSCRPEERFRLLRFDSDETGIYYKIFDRYILRPTELENLSLAEFAIRYETVSSTTWSEDNGDVELRDEEMIPIRYITLQDNSRMRVRNRPAVLRTRYYTVNSDKEAYYYSLIVCHIPFRNEEELLAENETAENCFMRRQGDLRPLQGNISAEEFSYAERMIQQAVAQVTALNAARENDGGDVPTVCVGEQIVNEDFCEDVGEQTVMSDELFLRSIRGLNIQQKDLFQSISAGIEKDLEGLESQLLLFITGGAGSGKTFLLKLIVEHIKRCYAPTVDDLLKPKFVEVGSLTGVAARQVFGKTLHSIFLLPIEKRNTMTYKQITGQRLENERRKWRYVNWLIIDEISMVSYEHLRMIHLRLQEFKNNQKLFGGVNVLVFGDIFQLPPVKGHWCFIQPPWLSAEVNLWHQFSFCELTINMRQRNDADFIDLLNNLRVGELTTAQLQLLCERRHVPLDGEFADGVAVRIFPTIRQVDFYNDRMSDENSKLHKTYVVNAVDESREVATYGRRPPENVIPKDVNNCGGLLSSIKISVESRIMLRRNIDVSQGLVNGAMGIIKKIKWPALRRDQLEEGELPEAVYIKFDDDSIGLRLKDSDGCIPIPPVCTTFQAVKGYGDVERRMLPLILSWASLLHKISEHRLEGRTGDENSNASNTSFSGAQINRVIQTLAHKYCVDSKGHFEDLSKIIQKVLACRKELVAFDRSQSELTKGDTLPVYAGLLQNYDGDVTKGGGCYGCALACAEHCLTLLRALASQAEHRTRLCRFGLVQELVQHNLHRGTPQCQEEVRALICLVTRDNLPATEHLCNLLSQRITLSLMGHAASQDHNNSVRPLVLLLGSLVKVQDSVECWESRLRCIVKLWVWCCPQLTEVAGITPAANTILKAEALAGIPGINSSSPNFLNCHTAHQFALQQVALPCLRYMQQLMAPLAPPAQPPAPAQPAPADADQAKDAAKHQFALQQVALPCLRYMQQLMAPLAPPAQPPAPAQPAPADADQAKDAAKHQFALQQVALPCLRYMQQLMAPLAPPAQPPAPAQPAPADADQAKDAAKEPVSTTTSATGTAAASTSGNVVVDLAAWLAGKVPHSQWRRLSSARVDRPPVAATMLRDLHLASKYLAKWRERTMLSHGMRPLALEDGGWLRPVMFDPSSRIARDTACQMVKSLCDSYERTKAVLILLTSFLPEVGSAGEASEQFLQLYQTLASEAPWKQFLALRGVLQQIADLMTKEIEQLHRLEETTLTSDLAQGYALKRLTELLAMFLEESGARRTYKGRLVGAVLGGYLSLRRLVVQRTRLTDDTQEKLLELLEEMTTGTEAETAEFMAVCIETVQKYPLHDYRTPVFIFERLCSIIYPEENDVGEFFLTLEKDPQQEDFLQGRMLGNPYSSLEPGMGPLMRDVKNKICTDCELVALLEDDNGMELLVCNKIMSLDLPVKDVYKKNKICTDCELVALLEDDNGMELLVCNKIMSLDLPVKDVYKKVWCTSGEGVDAMRVVYRMRGLLGDATEEFVERLTQANAEAVDDEQLYRMANVLADCGGIEVMLQRLAAIQRVGAARALCSTLLRLVSLCTRVRRCVRVLTRAETRALPVLLHALHLAAIEEKDMARAQLVYQLLEIMERILSVAASESLESFLQFSLTFGGPEYVQALLNCTECPGIRNNSVALGHLTRVLAALVYGNDLKMAMLVEHFKPVLDFDRLDSEQWTEEEFRMELFCVFCANIERNSIGGTLKDYLISLGVVRDALEYIVKHAPCVKPTLVCTDSDELKEFISRPALKYILRFLTGLAADHEPTQMLVCEKVIPIVHRLEQVSSGEHVGSLAENLLEALRSQPQCAAKVQQVRDFTRQEKKRLAMAVRERQLGALGMRSNERGQVTAQCSLTQQVADLAEENGAVCCICREGYKYQPTKVLGIYTFTKRCPVEEYEVRARKTLGYTTVSHYNIVHVECHMAAVRLARARDEWESAALQNASTRCNGLLPLWGPHVPESAFASCLARHTTYLQECTGHRDIGHTCTLHDLKLLLLRFARGRTFHDDTGGGGPLSNMQLVPALIHMALYVINTSRVAARELSALEAALAWAPARLLESAHDAEGPLYFATLMLMLYPHAKWRSVKLDMLKRLLVIGHVRGAAPGGPAIRALPADLRAVAAWADYKPYALFVAIIDQLYTVMFKNVSATTVDQWPIKLAEYIRHNDEANGKAAERIVTTLTDELLPCASFAEFCDAAGFLEDIPDPDAFLQALIDEQP
ncbi:hypothetical protein B5X24_HaOG206881 [Helicoverpa armigera]|uniref:ATP-dependent DNA helicase n=1 Tax=Helicoverpa armigera TaxID=29058 RepID=A0A2W1BJA7_HELAM|nr:hypothetical protein B5X24_HaOG206881 [Helicoverpa armigera]